MFGGFKHFWQGLFDSKVLKAKHIVLIALAALVFIAMILKVEPEVAIPAGVIFYLLDPLVKYAKSLAERRNKSNQRDVVETNLRRHLQRKRRELPSNQPELPLSLPPTDRSEPS
ncbi:hypothetical protein [Bradyrhizobium sp.]|uniref:hypothetical protein n=1 Tax=Bradyrhizobium sp. TaxID=376 RepID=UPI000A57BD80|nr:hypothetical protein [Bradyrhizobium sp.]